MRLWYREKIWLAIGLKVFNIKVIVHSIFAVFFSKLAFAYLLASQYDCGHLLLQIFR